MDGAVLDDDDDDDSDEESEDTESNDSTELDLDNLTIKKDDLLGDRVQKYWRKRCLDLNSGYAIKAWYLNPMPEVMEDRKSGCTYQDRLAVQDTVLRLMHPTCKGDEPEVAVTMNKFWDEFDQFETKSGVFANRKYIYKS